jgi:hypothetical protein
MSLSFFTTWHIVDFMINIIILLRYLSLLLQQKTFAGLNAGMLCAGILLLFLKYFSFSSSFHNKNLKPLK